MKCRVDEVYTFKMHPAFTPISNWIFSPQVDLTVIFAYSADWNCYRFDTSLVEFPMSFLINPALTCFLIFIKNNFHLLLNHYWLGRLKLSCLWRCWFRFETFFCFTTTMFCIYCAYTIFPYHFVIHPMLFTYRSLLLNLSPISPWFCFIMEIISETSYSTILLLICRFSDISGIWERNTRNIIIYYFNIMWYGLPWWPILFLCLFFYPSYT